MPVDPLIVGALQRLADLEECFAEDLAEFHAEKEKRRKDAASRKEKAAALLAEATAKAAKKAAKK